MDYSEYLEEAIADEAFNTGLMLAVWAATAITVLVFVLCYYHFKNQESMLENQEKTNDLLRETNRLLEEAANMKEDQLS